MPVSSMIRIALWSIIFTSVPANGDVDQLFETPVTYAAGRQPEQVIVSDLDHDSDLDVIAVNRFSDDVSIYMNASDGTMAEQVSYDAGENAISVAVGDLNNDSHPDLAVINDLNTPTISVLFNNGDGTFAPPSMVLLGTTDDANWVAIADLDNDGNQDLIATISADSNGIRVMYGNGDGTFGPPVALATSGGVGHIRVGDVNNNGFADLILAHSSSITVLINNTIGGFLAPMDYVTGGSIRELAVKDFNGDGLEDIAVMIAVPGDVQILTNTGFGLFELAERYEIGFWSESIDSTDVDNDGDNDLVIIIMFDNFGRAMVLMRNNGDATFAEPILFDAANNSRSITTGDLDQDGNQDFITTLSTGDAVRVTMNTDAGVPAANSVYLVPDNAWDLTTRDLDGLMGPDLVWASPFTNEVGVTMNSGDGTFGSVMMTTVTGRPYALTVADVDGFGVPDVIAACKSIDAVKVLVGDGSGSFVLIGQFDVGVDPVGVTTADLDLDGDLDLIVSNSGDNSISVLINIGFWNFEPAVHYDIGSNPLGVVVGDLDGVGGPEVIVSSGDLIIFEGVGDGTLGLETRIGIGTGAYGVALGDLNNDGVQDLVATSFSFEGASVYLGNGDSTFTPGDVFATPDSPRAVKVHDIDEDGFLDILVSTLNVSVNVYRNDGAGGISMGAGDYGAYGTTRDGGFVVADFNNDARPDLATGATGLDPRITVRLNSCIQSVCPPDLNGDGQLDFFDISKFLVDQIDYNSDTVFDFFDISAFLTGFGGGCP